MENNTTQEGNNEVTNNTEPMLLPVFIGITSGKEEKEFVKDVEVLLKKYSNEQVQFELAVMSEEMYKSSASLFYMNRLSKDQSHIIEKQKQDQSIIDSHLNTIAKITERLIGGTTLENRDVDHEEILNRVDEFLTMGTDIKTWHKMLNSVAEEKLSNKDVYKIVKDMLDREILSITSVDVRLPFHKLNFGFIKDSAFKINVLQKQIEFLHNDIKKKQDYMNNVLQKSLNDIVGKFQMYDEPSDEVKPATEKPKKKRVAKPKKTKEVINSEGELNTTTESINDRTTDTPIKGE